MKINQVKKHFQSFMAQNSENRFFVSYPKFYAKYLTEFTFSEVWKNISLKFISLSRDLQIQNRKRIFEIISINLSIVVVVQIYFD